MTRPPLLDPQIVPILGRDTDLPMVEAERMQGDALRTRFAAPPQWQAEFLGDSAQRLDAEREVTLAAVLVPIVLRELGAQILLTRRATHLRDHAGQISFPGGRIEPEDVDPVAAALRETEEEIGLSREHIEIIGQLPAYATVTSYHVVPVVGLVRPGFSLNEDISEVAEAFEVPLQFLMNPANHQRHGFELAGVQRQFLAMPFEGLNAAGLPQNYFIWGATAAMLRNLYRFLMA